MSNSITNRQLFFVLFITLTTYTTIDLPKIMAETCGRTSWIPIITVAILFGIVAIIITKLNNMYQGKVFFDYSQEIVGTFFKYLIAIYYLFYFLMIGVFLKVQLVTLLTTNFLPKTSNYIVLLFAMPLFAYIAYKGITNIARLFEIFGALFIFVTLFLCFFMVSQGMLQNILPVINIAEAKDYFKTAMSLAIPYGGIEILLIIPFSQINKKAAKVAFWTLFMIGLFYVFIVQSTIMILGINNTIVYTQPFIEAIKTVDFPIIERTDIFYLTFGLSSLFCGMIIVFIGALEFACKIFKNVKRSILTIIISIIIFILTLLEINIKNIIEIYHQYLTIPLLFSAVIIPITLFIIAIIKKRAADQTAKETES